MGTSEPEQLNGLRISPGFLPTLGVSTVRGRGFKPTEDVPNGPSVCILSYEFWQTHLGGRESVIGDVIRLNGLPCEVVGIMPPLLSNPFTQTQVFVPRIFEFSGLSPQQIKAGATAFQVIARLRPGISVEQANAEMVALGKDYAQRFGSLLDSHSVVDVRSFADTVAGNLRPTFLMLLGAVVLVQLIASANVAGLFLARLSARHREIAVRQSLGASRGAIIRQFLVESLIFCAAAGLLGILFAHLALSWIQGVVASQLALTTTLRMNGLALAYTAAMALASALVVGIYPAIRTSRPQVSEVLKDNIRGASGGARASRFRSILIVSEVALSVALLVASSLLEVSFVRLQRIPSGFKTTGVAGAFVGIPLNRYGNPDEQARFFNQVLGRLRQVPQVRAAAATTALPLSGTIPQSPYSVVGRPILPLPQRPLANYWVVSDGYFDVLRIPLHAGRFFTLQDRKGAPLVCIINSTLAKHLFPGESALGHALLHGRNADIRMEIVGVIEDVKSNGLNVPVPDEVFYPMAQTGYPGMVIIAATDGNPRSLEGIIRTAVAGVDREQPISFFQTMDTSAEQSLGSQQVAARITLIFAGLALILAAVGLYSVLAYSVAQRTGEIGIRLALGAQRGQIIAMVLSSGLRLLAIGLVIGLAAAACGARLIASLLYFVDPLDPVIFGAAAFLFAGVALVACLVPSMRASRLDPVAALRAAE